MCLFVLAKGNKAAFQADSAHALQDSQADKPARRHCRVIQHTTFADACWLAVPRASGTTHLRASCTFPACPCCTTVFTSPPAQNALSPAPWQEERNKRNNRTPAVGPDATCACGGTGQIMRRSCHAGDSGTSLNMVCRQREARRQSQSKQPLALSTMHATLVSASHRVYRSYKASTMRQLSALSALGRFSTATPTCC